MVISGMAASSNEFPGVWAKSFRATTSITATAWATNEAMSNDSAYVPATTVAVEQPATTSEGVAPSESLSPNESVAVANDAAVAPAPEPSIAQPGITVQERRLSEDERMQLAVLDKLASSTTISGKIGVETNDAVVTLTGYTSTSGQAYRAERDARSIVGVRYVQNEIRPRVGGSVS